MKSKTLLQNGVVIEACSSDLVEHIAQTSDACVMQLGSGQAIAEHTHGNSMYFAKNVKSVTIEGIPHTLPKYSWVFIPEGLLHGWRDVQDASIGTVFSYHPNHKEYSLV